MQYDFDYLVFIGRFQPFHNGHLEVLCRALRLAEKVIVLLGSARRPRTIKDPWNVAERTVMISACFPDAVSTGRLLFEPILDRMYNDQQWAAGVQAAVQQAMSGQQTGRPAGQPPRIGIIGHTKDRSSFYLRMFPQWELIDVPNIAGLSATEIRSYLLDCPLAAAPSGIAEPLDQGTAMLVQSAVPGPVYAFLDRFRATPYFAPLVEEFGFIKTYRSQFAGLKYPVTFQTVDAVVVQSGHVLMVQRRATPGAGLWALPGGFVDPQERLVDAMLRELREETRLKVPEPVLRGSIKGEKVFDHPERSLRGRTITDAFLIELADGPLHPVKGSDDAAKARWIPIAQAMDMDEQVFEDHMDILRYFLGTV